MAGHGGARAGFGTITDRLAARAQRVSRLEHELGMNDQPLLRAEAQGEAVIRKLKERGVPVLAMGGQSVLQLVALRRGGTWRACGDRRQLRPDGAAQPPLDWNALVGVRRSAPARARACGNARRWDLGARGMVASASRGATCAAHGGGALPRGREFGAVLGSPAALRAGRPVAASHARSSGTQAAPASAPRLRRTL
jgi:hypothetical protein